MESDPQDEQWTLPGSRDGEPRDPLGDSAGVPSSGSSDAPLPPGIPDGPVPEAPSSPAEGTAPPLMPMPPRMPSSAPPPSAWGSAPPSPPVAPGSQAASSLPPGTPRTPGAGDVGSGDGSAGADEPSGTNPPVEGDAEQTPPVPDDAPDVTGADSAAAPHVPSDAAPPPRQAAVAPVIQGDWLASVCPYLASEDGTYRSAAPDEGHRCTAQDPAATLPLAFQERFCLTDRHPRCEMYKFAQETDSSGAIPIAQVPPTDPPTPITRSSSGGDGPRRPVLVAAAGIAGLVVLVILLVLLMGSCSGDGGSTVDGEPTPEPPATEEPVATPEPTPTPTPEPDATPTPEPDPDATPVETDEAAVVEITILYEIQPDEALLKVSETFGISRNRIRKANPGLEEFTPAELPGKIIEIPISGDMTLEAAAALPGYQGIAP